MPGAQLSVVYDDKRSDSIALGPNEWAVSSAAQWFNGTSQSPDFALRNNGPLGTLRMKFQGTSVAFFGTTPPDSASQAITVSIDGNTPYTTNYSDPNPQTYRQWYQSPLLEDGSHNISLSNIAGTAFDFAVVTVGDNTPLTGQRVIADSDNPGFTFNGKWRRNQALFNSGPNPDGFPYHNSTHETTYVGSSFAYRFSGRSAAIYGIFTWSNIGLISLTFTLDGQSLPQNYRVNADTPQFVSEIGQQQNFLFYSYDFLEAGDHTLVVNVTECVNQTFAFDYITYTPSFATLANMPNLTQMTPGSDNVGGQTSQISSTAAIVGVVAGAIILMLLLGLAFLFRRRRKGSTRRVKYEPLEPFMHQRSEVTDIPLGSQTSPPPTASTYHHDTMALMQSASAASQFGFTSDPRMSMANSPGQVFTPATPATTAETGTSGYATAGSAYRTSQHSEWDGSTGEPLTAPPSYDESTRGQHPLQVTYVIQR